MFCSDDEDTLTASSIEWVYPLDSSELLYKLNVSRTLRPWPTVYGNKGEMTSMVMTKVFNVEWEQVNCKNRDN